MKEKKKEYISSLVEKKGGKLTAVASDETVDRMGDSLSIKNWDFGNFKKNPVMQLSHDYSQVPIGVVKNLKIVGKKLTFEPVFHEFTQAAREVKKLYDEGIMKAFSVGFIWPREEGGKFELLEISAVSIPANPNALIFSKEVDKSDMLKVKAWVVSKKEEKEEEKKEEVEENEKEEVEEKEVEENEKEEVEEKEGEENETDEETIEDVVETKETDEKVDTVQEQLDENETRKKKWEKVNKLDNAFYAFYNVYMDKDMPLDKFKDLTIELSGIIKGIANGKKGFESDTIKEIEGSMKEVFKEKEEDEVEVERKEGLAEKVKEVQEGLAELKAGKVISKKNQTMISETITNLKGTITKIEKLVDAKEEEEKEGEEKSLNKEKEQKTLNTKVEKEKEVIGIKEIDAEQSKAIILKAMQQVAKNANLALNKLKQDN